ncbi:hypothetical protein Kpol_2000p67 [Vanderwaltozyma polyspora DSM 70294]|uniref:GDP/GTP exchange factor Sec2 N-terminal domain-containing protein n=1 Tax=Vanderwaltozyma polyspora (strain ATCC 22028 / DSM 70294 / BCRC 21397 / CBS 2163 / NBRC 10782 / NRRL Y-8283 / UCD 57-17) TaxID=436907 RepID=A7TF74_VANPO|nr:uncharacterized protein Kpol_2000p67 [Vanderwaltozyma polyspora DSM 70294]EDO19099.1 hypothetical protein Kpol_2000p67 [Vanderwaltozyma polyspora DSM 70294]
MEDSSDESKRFSIQLTTLSTQLMESINKQTQLEDKLQRSRRTIMEQQTAIEQYNDLKVKYDQLDKNFNVTKVKIAKLENESKEEHKLRLSAEQKVDELNKEVEELTASLFDEANNMVADARRGAQEIDIKNRKLVEMLHEKDTILETMNLQLKNLKNVLHDLQNDPANIAVSNRNSLISTTSASSSSVSLKKTITSNSTTNIDLLSNAIYTPKVPAVRYDLYLYNEFLKFIAVLPFCESIKHTTSESKLLRRLINDEIQPVLRLDNASGLGWIVKRTLMNLMIEGLVVIEPLSGVNENYRFSSSAPVSNVNSNNDPKLTSKNDHLFKYPSNSPPIAVHEPCAFCGENRNDVLEHARMYMLKTQTKNEDNTLSITNQFPLCQMCLIKVRQTCEIFAFLRSLKLGAWNLEKVTLSTIAKGDSKKFSSVTAATSSISKSKIEEKFDSKLMKRRSIMAGFGISSISNTTTTKSETSVGVVDQSGLPTTNIQRAWVHLSKLRSMLHWAHIGIWNTDNAVTTKLRPELSESNQNGTELEDQQILANINNTSEESFTSVRESVEPSDNEDDEPFDFETNESTIQDAVPANAEVNDGGETETETENHLGNILDDYDTESIGFENSETEPVLGKENDLTPEEETIEKDESTVGESAEIIDIVQESEVTANDDELKNEAEVTEIQETHEIAENLKEEESNLEIAEDIVKTVDEEQSPLTPEDEHAVPIHIVEEVQNEEFIGTSKVEDKVLLKEQNFDEDTEKVVPSNLQVEQPKAEESLVINEEASEEHSVDNDEQVEEETSTIVENEGTTVEETKNEQNKKKRNKNKKKNKKR